MARNAGQADQRRQLLLAMLARGEEIATVAVARRLGVSPMTIRRDLRLLETTGAALRRYGGAVPAQRISFEFAFDERHRRHLPEKRRIGTAAAALVRPGEMLYLDSGTTTLELARALARGEVACRVATSSLVIASELWGKPHVELLLLGGRVRQGSPDLVGPATEALLTQLTADLAFLGSEGIHPKRGSFAQDLESAQVAQLMATNTRRTVVIADSSKLGRAGGALYLPLADLREIITDDQAEPQSVAALRRLGVTVTLV